MAQHLLGAIPAGGHRLYSAFATLPGDSGKGTAPSASPWSVLDQSLVPNLLVNLLVAAVMMTTLVVGPFYLDGEIISSTKIRIRGQYRLDSRSGVPSGQLVDSWGSGRVLAVGLALLAVGAFLVALLPKMIGVVGYGLSIVVLTPGYQLFQAANNTAALAEVPKDWRGTVSGLLSLSRNIGLIAGASAMGAVFSLGVGTERFGHAAAPAIAAGMQLTFLLAGGMMIAAIAIAFVRAPGQA